LRVAALRYLRGVAIALVGGFWAGALVTGPAIRLIMRLLAVTAGDAAQGRITEADEVVGKINVDGTIGLIIFGGILPGLLSGAIYVVVRRWLPGGVLGGVTFGALHLVLAATRIDPLRPGNPDFDLVGPGWLAVLTFGLAAIFHGMAVVAIANRYSHAIPPRSSSRAHQLRAILPVIPPALLLVPGISLLVPLAIGLLIALVGSQISAVVRALRSRAALLAGRVAISLVVLATLPNTLNDLRSVVVRDNGVAWPGGSAVQSAEPLGSAAGVPAGTSGAAHPAAPLLEPDALVVPALRVQEQGEQGDGEGERHQDRR